MSLIVLKVGGELFKTGELKAVAEDAAALVRAGHRLVLVHGGGPQVSALQRVLGQTPVMVAGRRVTDAPALDVLKLVLAGQLNVELCGALTAVGLKAVGLHGGSSGLILAVKRPPKVVTGAGPDPVDYGLVGDVVSFDLGLLHLLLDDGRVPVLACLGADAQGQALNINGDTVANQVAQALNADHLVLVTSAPGVLRDLHDPSSRLPRLTVAEARAALIDGTVQGGMIAKLEESIAVLTAGGVGALHIVGQVKPGDLLAELAEPGSRGTALLP